jgi:hypothetical protein
MSPNNEIRIRIWPNKLEAQHTAQFLDQYRSQAEEKEVVSRGQR